MDFAGHMLSYNSAKAELSRLAFSPDFAPDFFALSPSPVPKIGPVTLQETDHVPESLPVMEMQALPNKRVAFLSLENNRWLTSDLFGNSAAFQANKILEWEQFIPLTFEDIAAISILASSENSLIEDCYGSSVAPLRFNPDGTAALNHFSFLLLDNLDSIRKLSDVKSNLSYHLTLYGLNQKKECFEVTRKKNFLRPHVCLETK